MWKHNKFCTSQDDDKKRITVTQRVVIIRRCSGAIWPAVGLVGGQGSELEVKGSEWVTATREEAAGTRERLTPPTKWTCVTKTS